MLSSFPRFTYYFKGPGDVKGNPPTAAEERGGVRGTWDSIFPCIRKGGRGTHITCKTNVEKKRRSDFFDFATLLVLSTDSIALTKFWCFVFRRLARDASQMQTLGRVIV